MNASCPKPTVIHEDNHLLVINKPPLLATMGVAEGQASLVTWTKDWLKQKYNKPGNVYLGVVSRLDSFTCGLIVIARTSKAAGRMTTQFQKGLVQKTYTAILEGDPGEPNAPLIDWLVKNDQRRRMVIADPTEPQAKRAELKYQVLGSHESLTLVKVQLVTGRKHQIRVQFSSRGCPILGDRKYDGQQNFYCGIALQSSQLSFEHPVRGERLSFRIDPPRQWNLARFKSN